MHNSLYYVVKGVERTLYYVCVLVTILDTYFIPEAPEALSAAPDGLHWCLNDAHWLTIPHGQTHNVVAFLRLESAIGECGAPLPKGPRKASICR